MQLFLNLMLNPIQSIFYSNPRGTLGRARDAATQNQVDYDEPLRKRVHLIE